MAPKKGFRAESATHTNFLDKMLYDELEALRNYELVFIPCIYTKEDRIAVFRKMIENDFSNMEYREVDTNNSWFVMFERTDYY